MFHPLLCYIIWKSFESRLRCKTFFIVYLLRDSEQNEATNNHFLIVSCCPINLMRSFSKTIYRFSKDGSCGKNMRSYGYLSSFSSQFYSKSQYWIRPKKLEEIDSTSLTPFTLIIHFIPPSSQRRPLAPLITFHHPPLSLFCTRTRLAFPPASLHLIWFCSLSNMQMILLNTSLDFVVFCLLDFFPPP